MAGHGRGLPLGMRAGKLTFANLGIFPASAFSEDWEFRLPAITCRWECCSHCSHSNWAFLHSGHSIADTNYSRLNFGCAAETDVEIRPMSVADRPRLCENIVFEVNADAACALISLLGNRRVGHAYEEIYSGRMQDAKHTVARIA